MGRLTTYCHSCTHWKWDENIKLPNGRVIFDGHCGMFSCACINSVAGTDGFPTIPPHFQSLKDTYEADLSSVKLESTTDS